MKKDPKTLAELSGICKAIKEKFKYDIFPLNLSLLLMLSLNYLQIKLVCLITL